MCIKILGNEQIAGLEIGMIIKRFPSNGGIEDVFDKSKPELIDTYVIKSIYPLDKMIGLVISDSSLPFYASSGDAGRLFIYADNLVDQKIWWL